METADYPLLPFAGAVHPDNAGKPNVGVALTASSIAWGNGETRQERRFAEISAVSLLILNAEAKCELSFRTEITFLNGKTLLVFCHWGGRGAISRDECAYRDFVVALHARLGAQSSRLVQYRNVNNKWGVQGLLFIFPFVVVLAGRMLLDTDTFLVVKIGIGAVIIGAYVFAFFVLQSPARGFYDPAALPPVLLPSEE